MRKVYLLSENNKTSVKIDSVEVISLEELEHFSTVTSKVGFWLVDGSQHIEFAQRALDFVRNQLIPGLYLRPVVFLISPQQDVELIGCDAFFYINENHQEKATELLSKFELTNQWIDKLPNVEDITETELIFRILRLIVSRNAEIVPMMTAKRTNGFVYPILDSLVKQDDSSIFRLFDFLEAQNLLVGHFITHAHFCCQCQSAFLNFKEICPRCDAENITTDELIHHFKCAYVAESSEYRKGDRLFCPKCDRELKHIGVDFDKPSLMSHCNQCDFKFQEPKVITQCFNCGNHAEPENQIYREIKAYQPTALGRNGAIFGLNTLFNKVISAKVKFYSEPVFRQFLDVEVERIRRYKISASSLGFIKFIDIENIYQQQGANSEKFFEELSSVFKSILRNSDIVTAKNQSIFMILMIETSKENAQQVMQRLESEISVLLSANFPYKEKVSINIEELAPTTSLDHLLENFMAENVH